MSDRFSKLGTSMARHRRMVLAAWFLVFLASASFAPQTAGRLQGAGFDVPGSQSDDVADLLDRELAASSLTSAVVVHDGGGEPVTSPAFATAATEADERLAGLDGVASVRSFFLSGDPSLLSQDRGTAISVVALEGGESAAQDAVPSLRSALADAGVSATVTGFPAVQHDTFVLSEQDLRRIERVSIPVVAVLLLLFFGSLVAAAVPLVLGASAVVVATALLGMLGGMFPISIFALNVGSLIGLGLSIDFSLVMVRRYREERQDGRAGAALVAATMATSGRAIVYSGATLIAAMTAVTAIYADLMIVRSISLGVLLVSAVGLLAGVTLLPALLAMLGHRIDALRVLPVRAVKPTSAGVWYRLTMSVMRRPGRWLGATLVVLVFVAMPVLRVHLIGANTEAMPESTESARGAQAVEAAFGENTLTPISVLLRSDAPDGALTPELLTGLRRLTETVAADPRVDQVTSLSTVLEAVPDERFALLNRNDLTSAPPPGTAPSPPALGVPEAIAAQLVNVRGDGDLALLSVLPTDGMYDRQHQDLVADLRGDLVAGLDELDGVQVSVGGDAAAFVDFHRALYGRFPFVALVVTLLILSVLLLAFRSVLLPLKAAAMNLLALASTLGILVWLFQHGNGETLLGFASHGSLSVVTPVILFVIIFGLSTDYEVFVLSRVREQRALTGDTEGAVAFGVQQTAGLITTAALILVATFGPLAMSSVETLQQIGVGLAIGILLDATVVRLIMVPAAMQLMKEANWWIPRRLARLLPAEDLPQRPPGAPAAGAAHREGEEPTPVPMPAPAVAASDPTATLGGRP